MEKRIEHDTMGEVAVPADRLWGAQTQRSLENFPIGTERMPRELIYAFACLKKAAARVNTRLGRLPIEKAEAISNACDEILSGKLDDHFPLVVWQTGSGTQSNMNVNEVIARRASMLLDKPSVHPNDDVNCSQSSNDTFPSAMSIAAVMAFENRLLPALISLRKAFEDLSESTMGIVKIGRTHLQDATPLRLGQEVSGWAAMLACDEKKLRLSLEGLRELAIGGTAVGTGLNAPPTFGRDTAEELTRITGKRFISAPNKFQALTSKDHFVFAHGAMKALAADLMKIANDVRFLAGGPRCGLGELRLPENEPGSSIMPGKVNPTQCEAVTMVAVQVMGNDTAVGIAASQGNFELNVFMPVCIYNFLQSARLLADVMASFEKRCVRGITPNKEKIQSHLENSLMLVTALNPLIGYEKAAEIAKTAHKENITLREAALKSGLVDEESFDRYVDPLKMTEPLS